MVAFLDTALDLSSVLTPSLNSSSGGDSPPAFCTWTLMTFVDGGQLLGLRLSLEAAGAAAIKEVPVDLVSKVLALDLVTVFF